MNKWARPFEWNRASAEPVGRPFASAQHHYFAFLSYSHDDTAEADWLHDELEKFRVPSALAGKLTSEGVIPRRLTPIFRDRHELAAADDLGEEIREALAASRALIVLCSPAAAKSKWTNAEIELFKRLHPEGCVIAAIIAGEPFASDIKGREAEECLPAALRQKFDRRGRPTGRRTEPLCADLRESGDGRRSGFLKIVAGLLGLGLDDLVQRDHVRRQRRLAVISGGSFLGMLVATGLAVTAIQARDAARDQRREAESLVEFMLGDLRQKLEPIGRLDALDGVGKRVLSYYSKQDTTELSDLGLEQRSSALNLMAQVAYQHGNLEEAQELYREALAGTAEALRRSPDDPNRLYDYAQNVFWIGEIARFRGNPSEAASAYRGYRGLAYRLAALEPDNLKYRMEVLYGEENVAISLYNQRRFAEAANQFGAAFGSMEKLASLYPENVTYQNELANLLYWVAEAQRAEGRYDAAIATRERQIAFVGDLLNGGMSDVQLRRQAIVAHMALGILLSERFGPLRGESESRTAVEDADGLLALEPRNARWQLTAVFARQSFARQLLAADKNAEAAAQAAEGCRLASGLNASGAAMSGVRMAQTDCLYLRARLALARGAIAEADAAAQRTIMSARSERNEDPVADRYRIALAYLLLGDVRQRSGDSSAATAAWREGLAQLPKGTAERPQDMQTRAELLRRVGRAAEARPLAAKLAAIGYKSSN
jgi:tetratricopeptide (TPR) repeat protein